MDGNCEAKAKAQAPEPEARCWIDKGMLRVEVPLFMPNGEYIAYGMLHKAQHVANEFFRHIEREAVQDQAIRSKILTPIGGGPIGGR